MIRTNKRYPEPEKFTSREFERRVERACTLMNRDAILVTSETNVE